MRVRAVIRSLRGGGEQATAPQASTASCLATCLGNALIAYWGAGKSWGAPNFIIWMTQDPRLPIYAHVARRAIGVVESSAVTQDPEFWKEIRRLKRRLDRFEGREAAEGQ